jgi:hypothetical protein
VAQDNMWIRTPGHHATKLQLAQYLLEALIKTHILVHPATRVVVGPDPRLLGQGSSVTHTLVVEHIDLEPLRLRMPPDLKSCLW